VPAPRSTLLRTEIARARAERCRSQLLTHHAEQAIATARHVVSIVESRQHELLVITTMQTAGRFRLRGLVADRVVDATCREGRLSVDPVLWATAEMVVEMGDLFTHPETGRIYVADLGHSFVPTLLTLIRALDVVQVADVWLSPERADED
jgi:hypothetical protein